MDAVGEGDIITTVASPYLVNDNWLENRLMFISKLLNKLRDVIVEETKKDRNKTKTKDAMLYEGMKDVKTELIRE